METVKKGTNLMIIAVILILGAIFTLLPIELADDKCYFGYSAVCPFTPISSIVLFAAAWYIFMIRKNKLKTK
jgi:hypothetical protein